MLPRTTFVASLFLAFIHTVLTNPDFFSFLFIKPYPLAWPFQPPKKEP